jgi:hypothetical protein
MASPVPAVKGQAYTIYIGLEDQANAGEFKTAPTIVAGDFQVSTDGSALSNLDTLPVVTPAGSRIVKVAFSADEMNGDWVVMVAHDASGSEWYDRMVAIPTAAQTHDTIDTNVDSILTNLATAQAAIDLNTVILSPVGGTTDGDGAVDGSTVLDSTRSEDTGHWTPLALRMMSGDYDGTTRTVNAYTQGVGFTVTPSFGGQILSGTEYRVIAAIVYQPGIVIRTDAPQTVEPDTSMNFACTIITNNGRPEVGDITEGVITISRVRAGVSTDIVSGAACSKLQGNVYYTYTFPAASWQAGDLFQGLMSGQEVTVNGINYPMSIITLQGRVSREPDIVTDTGTTLPAALATVDANVDAILLDTGTDGVVVGSFTTAAKAEINTEADTALSDIDLDHLIQVTAGSEEPTDGSYLDQVMHKAAGQSYDGTTDSLEAIRDAIRNLPQTRAQAAASTDYKLAAVAYTTYSEAISGSYTTGKTANKVTMTIKQSYDEPDAKAVLQANSTDGLTVLNGESSVTAGQVSIAYDQSAGTVTPTIKDAAMILIGLRSGLVYDIKIHYDDGESSRFSYGEFSIANTPTRAVT